MRGQAHRLERRRRARVPSRREQITKIAPFEMHPVKATRERLWVQTGILYDSSFQFIVDASACHARGARLLRGGYDVHVGIALCK
jgi:hypothetical protein